MNQEQYKSKQNQIAKLQEEVNTYEERQNKIKEYKKQMSELVKSLVQHKFFYVDNTVIFVGFGYTNNGLVQGLLHGVAKTCLLYTSRCV